MERFDEDFKFFKSIVDSFPGENDASQPLPPQTLSRSELQERLEAKMESVRHKISEKDPEIQAMKKKRKNAKNEKKNKSKDKEKKVQ
jgi:RNA processing factor Prp31